MRRTEVDGQSPTPSVVSAAFISELEKVVWRALMTGPPVSSHDILVSWLKMQLNTISRLP